MVAQYPRLQAERAVDVSEDYNERYLRTSLENLRRARRTLTPANWHVYQWVDVAILALERYTNAATQAEATESEWMDIDISALAYNNLDNAGSGMATNIASIVALWDADTRKPA